MAQEDPWASLELRNPGRQSLISTIRGFWSTSPPAFIYIYDPLTKLNTANLLSDLLSLLENGEEVSDKSGSLGLRPGLLSARIDGTECVSPKVLFDRVLNGLANWTPKWEDGCLNWASTKGENYSDNFDAFVHGLRTLYEEKGKSHDPFASSQSNQGKNVVIVVTYAERLKESIPNLVAPLARLADLTNLPISTLFLSHLPWEDIQPSVGSAVLPFTIYLTPLTSDEVLDTLKYQFKTVMDDSSINAFHPVLQSIFDSFTELVYGICTPYTQEPIEIAYIMAANWPLYISPILNDWEDHNNREEEYEIPAQAQTRLNALFRQTIGASVQQLYPRQIHANAWLSQIPDENFKLMLSQTDRNTVIRVPKSGSAAGADQALSVVRLPVMARYLLVASYLASFNPAKMDARILSQTRDPTKRFRKIGGRKNTTGAAIKVPPALAGPGAISFDRLWALSGALLEAFGSHERPQWADNHPAPGEFSETEVSRVLFFGQLEDLVSRRLLVRVSAREKLETQGSYRCSISLEQASAISDSLGFKLGPLLYEEAV